MQEAFIFVGFEGAVGFYSLTVIALNFYYISHVCFNLYSDTVCIFIIDGVPRSCDPKRITRSESFMFF